MAQISLIISVRKRWFFWPAVWCAALLCTLGLVRDIASDEYCVGVMPAHERAARWLAKYCLVMAADFDTTPRPKV